MRIPVIGGATGKGVSVNLDSQHSVNMMVKAANSANAKSPAALCSTPGLHWLSDADGTNKSLFAGELVRGLYEMPPLLASSLGLSTLLVVTSTHIVMVVPLENHFIATGILNYTYSPIATITAKYSRVSFAESPTTIVFTVGGNVTVGYAFALTTSSWAISAALIFDAVAGDYVPLCDVVYLDGFFVGFTNVSTASAPLPFRQMFYSANGTDWSAADYIVASATADTLKKLIVKNGHIWVFKGKSIPIFAPTGDSNNPFAPIESATINIGCLDGLTVAQEGNKEGDHIYWVSDNLVVYQTLGATGERISNAFVEKVLGDAIKNFGIQGLAGISAYCCVEDGHPLYKLSVPTMKTTLVWDALTKLWNPRGWWNTNTGEYEADIGWIYSKFNNLSVVGDRRSGLSGGYGVVYEISSAFHDNQVQPLAFDPSHDAGTDTMLRWEVTGSHISGKNHERLFIGLIEAEFEMGLAAATGQGSDPMVTLEISRNAGRTFGPGRTLPIGKVGEYLRRCLVDRNGSAYDFVPRFSGTDPIAWKLIAAYADVVAAP